MSYLLFVSYCLFVVAKPRIIQVSFEVFGVGKNIYDTQLQQGTNNFFLSSFSLTALKAIVINEAAPSLEAFTRSSIGNNTFLLKQFGARSKTYMHLHITVVTYSFIFTRLCLDVGSFNAIVYTTTGSP